MRCKHRFVATPITGQSMVGKEVLLGERVECEHCYKRAKAGDTVEAIRASWWKEIIPKGLSINITLGEGA
ncbi:hypothetical protein LCGC14_0902520 [marine sediment metagenome]|uniref:Uncharacterized protein n=1 Tax=marine sediment metagenome TaxID=412755 RepID=A0A0F9S2X5_9ZZZZ